MANIDEQIKTFIENGSLGGKKTGGDTIEDRRKFLKSYLNEMNDDLNEDGGLLSTVNKIQESIGAVIDSVKGAYDLANRFLEPWKKADEAASKFAKTIGMAKAGMDALRKSTIDNVVNAKIGINYNMSTDELIAAQEKYIRGIGRSLRIDNVQQENLAAMTAVMGESAIEFSTAFENFGLSLTSAGEHAGDMFAKASKHGISFEKLSENVVKNITIAQNYTFKNGLRGLESMAAKSAAIKMDMSQIAAFAEKVSTIEGSIDVASKLQVLGGPFAGASDPLGMLSEGLLDMEGLTDRIIKMVGGLGTFNKMTGEVEVSAFNKQRIKAAAQAMGMDYGQLMQSVNAQTKRLEIESQIRSSANASQLGKDMQELLKNAATFDEKGRAGVSIGGVFKTLDKIKDVDKSQLLKETQDQAADIKDIAKMLRSLTDTEEGMAKQYDAAKAQVAERSRAGQGMKYITTKLGEATGWLKAIAITQGVGTLLDMVVGKPLQAFGKIGKIWNITGKGAKGLKPLERVAHGIGESVGTLGSGAAKGSVLKYGPKRAVTRGAIKMFGKGGAKMLGSAAKGAGVGLVLGLAGEGLGMWRDNLLEKGKIEKGGTAHGAMNVGSSALKMAGLGAGIGSFFGPIGTAIGAGVGAVGGAIYGGIQNAKIRSNMEVENVLRSKGLTKKGEYGARANRQISEALRTGEISDRVRRKLERSGDMEILAAIDQKKEELEDKKAERESKKNTVSGNIRRAVFNVENAYFSGKFLGEGGIKVAPEVGFKTPVLGNNNGTNTNTAQNTSNEIEKGPINGKMDINISGNIKLVGSNGKDLDITNLLLSNDDFLKAITQKISTQIRDNEIGGINRVDNRSTLRRN